MAQVVKHLPAMQKTWVRSLGREDPLEKEMATHSSTLAWKIPWTEEPGGLQSTGLQRVGHNWATSLSLQAKNSKYFLTFYFEIAIDSQELLPPTKKKSREKSHVLFTQSSPQQQLTELQHATRTRRLTGLLGSPRCTCTRVCGVHATSSQVQIHLMTPDTEVLYHKAPSCYPCITTSLTVISSLWQLLVCSPPL